MLEVIKKQRDANKFTLYRTILLRVISVMSIFPHSIAPLKVVDHILRKASECTIYLPCFQNFLSCSNFLKIVSNSARMRHLAFLLSIFSQQFQLPKHCFKEHQNAPSFLFAFKIFSTVPTS